jgi:hypothetical protein
MEAPEHKAKAQQKKTQREKHRKNAAPVERGWLYVA